jgi:hypothetical protein
MVLLYGHFHRMTLFLLALGPLCMLCMDEGRARERRRLESEGFILPCDRGAWDSLRQGRAWLFALSFCVFAGGLVTLHEFQGAARIALFIVMGGCLLLSVHIFVDEVRKTRGG